MTVLLSFIKQFKIYYKVAYEILLLNQTDTNIQPAQYPPQVEITQINTF